MFDLEIPCANCPFRIGQGPLYRLPPGRLTEIFDAPAFQCHKTVGHASDGSERAPQQCAGLMAVLQADGAPNQIMRVASRLGALVPERLALGEAYPGRDAARAAHGDPGQE